MQLNPRDIAVENVAVTGGLRAAEGGQVEGFVTITGSLSDGRPIEAYGVVLVRTLVVVGGEA